MDMNNETNSFSFEIPSTVQTVFCDRTMTAEIEQDFILPDYQPEMRKLLCVTPSILPPSRFLGVGEAEFAGNISFAVLYIGADGALYTTDLTAPYTFRIPIEGNDRTVGDRPITVGAELSADAVMPRLQAPRKIRIKCRLLAHIVGRCDEETDMRTTGDRTESAPECLEHTCLCARLLYGMGEAIEVTDEVALPAGEGELRLIDSRGMVQMTEASLTEDGVICRGELYWKILYTHDHTAPTLGDGEEPTQDAGHAQPEAEVLIRRIPFSHTVELPTSRSIRDWEAMAYGTCTGINTRVEDGRIMCAATIVPEVQAMGNDKVTFTCDCFSTVLQSDCDMRTLAYDRAVTCCNGNVTESGSLPLAELGMSGSATPTDLFGVATVRTVTCERGHLILSGECLYQLLYRSPEGEFGFAEFRLPLRYEIPAECKTAKADTYTVDARAVMLGGHARIEGDTLTVDAEWAIAACITVKETIETVDELRLGAALPPREGSYILCYPDREESLWSIAKRYHAAIRPLAALNELPGFADPASPQSLEGVRFLMIG